jgi:hypothetical protein
MSKPTRMDVPSFPKSNLPAGDETAGEELRSSLERARLLLDDAEKNLEAIVNREARAIRVGRHELDAATQGPEALNLVAERFEEVARRLKEEAHRLAERRSPSNRPSAAPVSKPKLLDTVYSYGRRDEEEVPLSRRGSERPK